jgi:uncharacterized protein (UPF0332 family)
MSQAENKVNWCLKKAEKESKEGKKHRGLLKKQKDLERAREHISKAEHNLLAITYFDKGGFSDWSMSAVFYCMYHCFLAIIEKFGYESRNQECTVALVRYLKEQGKIDIDDKFIKSIESINEKERQESNVIEKRENYTYGTTISYNNKEEIKNAIELCKSCLDKTKEILFNENEK